MATKTFKRYALQEYIEQVLKPVVDKVRFSEIHVHGTWKPTISDFRKAKNKKDIIAAMWRFHTGTRKFSDIAQHASIDPDGYIWAGRPLLTPPASATDHNDSDNDSVHPFMFEMIGNFDKGCEKLEGAQLASAAGLCRAIMELWHRGSDMIHFHREFTNQKTCPGSGIEKAWFVHQVLSGGNEEDQPMTATEQKAFEALQRKVDEQSSALTVLTLKVKDLEETIPAPKWFIKEFGEGVVSKMSDPAGTLVFWRSLAVSLRVQGFNK